MRWSLCFGRDPDYRLRLHRLSDLPLPVSVSPPRVGARRSLGYVSLTDSEKSRLLSQPIRITPRRLTPPIFSTNPRKKLQFFLFPSVLQFLEMQLSKIPADYRNRFSLIESNFTGRLKIVETKSTINYFRPWDLWLDTITAANRLLNCIYTYFLIRIVLPPVYRAAILQTNY